MEQINPAIYREESEGSFCQKSITDTGILKL